MDDSEPRINESYAATKTSNAGKRRKAPERDRTDPRAKKKKEKEAIDEKIQKVFKKRKDIFKKRYNDTTT
jgi:hypothetical protein